MRFIMDVNCPAMTDYLNIQQFHFINELLKECSSKLITRALPRNILKL